MLNISYEKLSCNHIPFNGTQKSQQKINATISDVFIVIMDG